ncbi:hypothetical protein HAX54_000206 [Datura stramonium]|uniref:Uncharacterized protein n=1 Tax=Datura stramonium TaxID=4076 RepID=A0ABS8WPN1_DATST|nr:hypothetical protein [Datura stramonium]
MVIWQFQKVQNVFDDQFYRVELYRRCKHAIALENSSEGSSVGVCNRAVLGAIGVVDAQSCSRGVTLAASYARDRTRLWFRVSLHVSMIAPSELQQLNGGFS